MKGLFAAIGLAAVLLGAILGIVQLNRHTDALLVHDTGPEVSSLGHAQPLLEPKEQAAVAAVPEVDPASHPVSAVVVLHCRKIVGLGFIDGAGGFHDVPLEGMTKPIIDDLLASVPADKIAGYVVPCGGTDGTPI